MNGVRQYPYNPWELTDRQTEVIEALTYGLTYKQIAHRMGLATSTIRSHIHGAFSKMDVKNANEACSKWIRVVEGVSLPSMNGDLKKKCHLMARDRLVAAIRSIEPQQLSSWDAARICTDAILGVIEEELES